jgi:CBS domain-containing protein
MRQTASIGTDLAVSEIMTRDVLTVDPEYTLREVIETLTTSGVTGAPVLAGAHVVGVISMSDILEFIVSAPAVPSAAPQFSEWGDYENEADEPDADEAPVRFFTDMWDDAGANVAERFVEAQAPEWDLLGEYTAESLMTRKLESVTSDTSIGEVARRLIDRKIHRMLVVDDGTMKGIVSSIDLVRVLAEL